jgi:mono/diheme cytochrome c family protein
MKSLGRLAIVGLVAVLLAGCGQGSEPAISPSFGPDAEPSAARGYLAVTSRQCGQCHQSPDPRDGILSGRMAPLDGTQQYGSNLTPDPDTGMDAWDADTIANAVLEGVDDQGGRLCPPMPTFADAGMGYDEAVAIALYLQSLTPVRHFVLSNACPQLNPAKDAGAREN